MFLKDYMMELWGEIGYRPVEFLHARNDDDELYDDVEANNKEVFTPAYRKNQAEEDPSNLSGVSVRGFPLEAADSDLVVHLEESGMPKLHKEFTINHSKVSCTVDIENL